MPILNDLAAQFRTRLDRQSMADLKRLIDAYGQMSARLRDKVDLLVQEIQLNPDANVIDMQRYKDLIQALNYEYSRWYTYLETELDGIVENARKQSRRDTAALIAAAFALVGLSVRPSRVPQSAAPVTVLSPGTEMYRRLHELAPQTAKRIIDNLLEGINLGYGYSRLGKMIVDDLGLGLSDALRWARTVQMKSYRETAHNTMMENGNIIDGWVWWAQVDERTCEDCAGSHGTFHQAEERLNELTTHIWNCRCVELPHVRGDLNPVTGESVESE